MQDKPSIRNYQLTVTCPNCKTDVLVGMRRWEVINAYIAIPLFSLGGLFMISNLDSASVLGGLFVIITISFMGLILVSRCKNNVRRATCKTCHGIVIATYKDDVDGAIGWVTTFESTAASKTSTSPSSNKHKEIEPNTSQSGGKYLLILGGIVTIFIGFVISNIDANGDWPQILGYGAYATGAFSIFKGISGSGGS